MAVKDTSAATIAVIFPESMIRILAHFFCAISKPGRTTTLLLDLTVESNFTLKISMRCAGNNDAFASVH
jgi:hypothetical protein